MTSDRPRSPTRRPRRSQRASDRAICLRFVLRRSLAVVMTKR